MSADANEEGLCAGIRVLDLADDPGARAARILGDLGADVVRVVPPEGDALARRRADEIAWNAGKRVHLRSDLVLLVLDEPGEAPAPVSDGQAEGRAAFFDLSVDGRWGGTISGDRIRADVGTCACGRPGPTVFPDIVRFAKLADADKITCAGTMDTYVWGFIGE